MPILRAAVAARFYCVRLPIAAGKTTNSAPRAGTPTQTHAVPALWQNLTVSDYG
jgi:hypothetical protein